jgi:hypothetical protein
MRIARARNQNPQSTPHPNFGSPANEHTIMITHSKMKENCFENRKRLMTVVALTKNNWNHNEAEV